MQSMLLYRLIKKLKFNVRAFVAYVLERWPAVSHVERIHSLKRSLTCLKVLVLESVPQGGTMLAGINASHAQVHASSANLQVICAKSVILRPASP